MSTYLDRIRSDGWFAFANIALIGVAGYLLADKLSQTYDENDKRTLPGLLHKLSPRKKEKKEEKVIEPSRVFEESFRPREELIRDTSEFPVYKIAVTGGPCAGKTTAVEAVKKIFTERGFKVMVVPEVPTLLVKCGAMIRMDRFTSTNRISFQKMLMKAAIHLEDYFTHLASMNKAPGIVICDRGTMDPRAYISNEEFETILHDEGWTYASLRDRRYDEVIFMKTAADGAEQFYTLEGHVARHEGVQVAKQLDEKTLNGWAQHPRITIIPNVLGETFQDKINRVVYAVERIVGFSSEHTETLKYEVSEVRLPPYLNTRRSHVNQSTLVNRDMSKYAYEMVEKVQFNSSNSYIRVSGIKSLRDEVIETRRPVSSNEYIRLLDHMRDSSHPSVSIERVNFTHNNQFFTLDVIREEEEERRQVLSVTLKKGDEARVDIPDFIQIRGRL